MKIINFLANSSRRNTNYSETENLFAVRKKINLFLFLLHFFYLIYYSFHYLLLPATVALFVVIHMIILFFLKDQYKNRKLIFFNYSVLLFVNYFYDQYFLETQFVFHYLPLLLSVLLLFDLKNERKFSFTIIGLIFFFYIIDFLPVSYPFSKNAINNKHLYYVNLFLSVVITLYELYYITERFMLFKQENNKSSENNLSRLIDLAKNDETEFINYHSSLYSDFNNKLLKLAPDLTLTELSTCAYVCLKFSSKEIAQYTRNSIGAIETRKYRIRKKLNINNEKELHTFLIRFLSSVMRREIVAFLVFFIFNIPFAQITVVGDAQIHGAENIKIQTCESKVFVIEETTVYNLENSPRIRITYLKKNTTESQKPNRENFAFQKTKLSAEKKAEKTTTEKNISKTTCVYTSGKNTASFSSLSCNNTKVIPTHYKLVFTKIDTYYNAWNRIIKKKDKTLLLNKKFSSNCNSSYKIRPPPFLFFV